MTGYQAFDLALCLGASVANTVNLFYTSRLCKTQFEKSAAHVIQVDECLNKLRSQTVQIQIELNNVKQYQEQDRRMHLK